jgi:hypothetical protein
LLGYSNKITVSKNGYLRVVAPLSAWFIRVKKCSKQ